MRAPRPARMPQTTTRCLAFFEPTCIVTVNRVCTSLPAVFLFFSFRFGEVGESWDK